MAVIQFYQVDAFTDHALWGNPFVVVMESPDLSENTLQALALVMKISETAFILSVSEKGIAVRYFTPAEEIPFAGHPTIATCCALIESGRLVLENPKNRDHNPYRISGDSGMHSTTSKWSNMDHNDSTAASVSCHPSSRTNGQGVRFIIG